MDFSTIKKKLQLNVYDDLQAFLYDINLVFSNCKLYNGVESQVGKLGIQIMEETESLIKQSQIEEKFGKENQKEIWDKILDEILEIKENEKSEINQKIKEDQLKEPSSITTGVNN